MKTINAKGVNKMCKPRKELYTSIPWWWPQSGEDSKKEVEEETKHTDYYYYKKAWRPYEGD